MSADSPRRQSRGVPAIVPPQVVSDRSIIDSVAGFINDVTLTNQQQVDPKDTILWAKFEYNADISDPTYGDDWELEGNVAPPLLLILGYGLGIQVWAIPANGEACEVLSWRHGHVTALRILPTPISLDVEMADEPIDQYADKRPLMAISEGPQSGCNTQYSSINIVSLKDGSQVKTIKFKNNILDIIANRTSIVITFPERIAVFDARTFEDRLSVTTCYPSPGINPNPVALGTRWMAYSENRLIHSKRSGGGCDGDGVSSYTATVLNAAKSLGKGLRELGEQVAAGLTGTSGSGSFSKPGSFDSVTGDIKQPGVVTILDIKYSIKDVSPTTGSPISVIGTDPFVAHFIAHPEAIVALEFDNSGMLLLTADKRGHNFHIFRVQPHPAGSQLAAVHHLYILHRGDTSAKVQNIAFSIDSRWVAVSTLRGTTHVFPFNSYGGPVGVRTHASLHVVNRLSRFHRSAGLSADGRSSSPISHSDSTTFNQVCMPYINPTIPPFPRPHVILPLAQLRQPSVLGSPPGSAQNSYSKSSHGRQRLSSLSDDNGKPLSVCAIFAKARSYLLDPPNLTRETPAHKIQRKAVDSLFIMAGHGALIQYDLDTKLASNIAKEKICDDTPIELEVEAKAQWNLGRKDCSIDIQAPLPIDNWLMKERNTSVNNDNENSSEDEDRWLSQVEIITHAGPHRRLWMGPQCVFKTYNTPSGAPLSHIDTEAVEIGVSSGTNRPGRSSPMNMPLSSATRSSVPVLIESGSYSSIEQSPKLMDRFRHDHMDSDYALAHGESRLKEDLADAMRESPSVSHKEPGLTPNTTNKSMLSQTSSSPVPLSSKTKLIATTSSCEDDCNYYDIANFKKYSEDSLVEKEPKSFLSSVTTTAARSIILIEKVVNPLGTVTTITRSPNDNESDETNNSSPNIDYVIHENCDEALFRPVVAIFRDDDDSKYVDSKSSIEKEAECKPPEPIGTELIVPVIEKVEKNKKSEQNQKHKKYSVDNSINNKNDSCSDIEKNSLTNCEKSKSEERNIIEKFDELSLINKKYKSSSVSSNSKKQQNSKSEKEKTPPQSKINDKVVLSCENENYLVTKKVTKSERKKSREETKRFEETTYQQTKIQEKLKKDVEALDSSDLKSKRSQSQKDDITDKNSINFSEEAKLDEMQTSISNKSKQNLNKQEIPKNDDEILKEAKILEKDSINEQDKLIGHKKKQHSGSVSPTKQFPKVASDPKLSKFKSDLDFVEIKSASSEKSLKTSESKKKEKQQNSQFKSKKLRPSKDESKNMELIAKSDTEIGNGCDDTLKFYEKFSNESKEKLPPKEISLTQCLEIDIDVDNLTSTSSVPLDNKKIKKSKQSNTKVSSTQSSPKLSSTNSQKDIESVLVDAKHEDISVNESVTIKLGGKMKKSKRNSPTSEENVKSKNQQQENRHDSDEVDGVLAKMSMDSSEKVFKSKHFSALSFEPITVDLTDAFLPPLSPLEPFESKFESLYFKDASDDHVSLINFESPLQETNKSKDNEDKSVSEILTASTSSTSKSLNRKYSEENIVLALCGSLHLDEENKDSENVCQPPIYSTNECESDKDCSKASQYKSFERLNDNYEQYLSLERSNYNEHTSASSSEENEECLRTSNKKISNHSKLIDDDEELRPLIGGANSACSMTSSTGGGAIGGITDGDCMINNKKCDDTTIALEIAKAIIGALPDNNNQSDSSDQANSSEPGEMDGDIPISISKSGLINQTTVTTASTTDTTIIASNDDNLSSVNNKPSNHQTSSSSSSSPNNGCCNVPATTQSNGKKKTKKKKR